MPWRALLYGDHGVQSEEAGVTGIGFGTWAWGNQLLWGLPTGARRSRA